jgi:hypothetical protein
VPFQKEKKEESECDTDNILSNQSVKHKHNDRWSVVSNHPLQTLNQTRKEHYSFNVISSDQLSPRDHEYESLKLEANVKISITVLVVVNINILWSTYLSQFKL